MATDIQKNKRSKKWFPVIGRKISSAVVDVSFEICGITILVIFLLVLGVLTAAEWVASAVRHLLRRDN
ncbi:MAG: hypothetical protein LBM73_03935 [Candidatus Nomurabacteria bacterium]|jgi:hypothetical protein|nr:hypothetical protein [Candidatus Nomurabacteria bacterium]